MAVTEPKLRRRRNCRVCEAPLGVKNKYGYCRDHFLDSPEGYKALGRDRLADIPEELRDDYRSIRRNKGFNAAEARRVLGIGV